MTRWIRWKGFIPFVVITGLVTAFWLLFADEFVRRGIEKAGSSVVGAKVEVAGADLSLFPLGLTLSGVQITNPQDYMKNAVEFTHAQFQLDTLNLLRRKTIIDEMSIDGMQVGTPRKTSGDIPRSEKTGVAIKEFAKEKIEELELPSFDKLPDVKEILAKEDLESLKAIETAKADMQAKKEAWQKRLKELPNKDTINAYKEKIASIQKTATGGVGGALTAVAEADKVRKELTASLNQIKSAKNDLEKEIKDLQGRVKGLVEMPKRDVERLLSKYGISPSGLSNLTRLLLGKKAASYVEQAFYWHAKAKPFLSGGGKKKEEGPQVVKPARMPGRDVRFKEREPLPDFLIRTAHVGFIDQVGDFGGTLTNITNDQPVLGKPLKIELKGEKLKPMASAAIMGTLDHVSPEKAKDTIETLIKGYVIKSLPLSESERWPITLESGLGDADVKAAFAADKVDIRIRALLHSAKITTNFKEKSAIANAIASVLADVSRFEADIHMSGTEDNLHFDMTSDLDKLLQQAVEKLIRQQMAELQSKLMAAISDQVKGPLQEVTGQLGGFDNLVGDLTSRLDAGVLPAAGPAGKLPVPKIKLPFGK